jgi:hypothetical protein
VSIQPVRQVWALSSLVTAYRAHKLANWATCARWRKKTLVERGWHCPCMVSSWNCVHNSKFYCMFYCDANCGTWSRRRRSNLSYEKSKWVIFIAGFWHLVNGVTTHEIHMRSVNAADNGYVGKILNRPKEMNAVGTKVGLGAETLERYATERHFWCKACTVLGFSSVYSSLPLKYAPV